MVMTIKVEAITLIMINVMAMAIMMSDEQCVVTDTRNDAELIPTMVVMVRAIMTIVSSLMVAVSKQ